MDYLFYSSVGYAVIGMLHKNHRSIWLIVSACMLLQWVNVQFTDVEGVCRYWNRAAIVTVAGLFLLVNSKLWVSIYLSIKKIMLPNSLSEFYGSIKLLLHPKSWLDFYNLIISSLWPRSWLGFYHSIILLVTLVAYAALAYDVAHGMHILIYNNYEATIYGLVGCQLIAIFPTIRLAYRDHHSDIRAWLVNLQRVTRA